jgi:phosphoenolpyruvate synthase/pyruvate phosphate dikinase
MAELGYTVHLAESPNELLIGGKGASLARMIASGFPVPPAFTVTTDAYTHFMEENSLTDAIGEVLRDFDPMNFADMESRAQLIQGLFNGAAIPSRMQEHIYGAYEGLKTANSTAQGLSAVSVRSSATAEDSAGASFAGQHDTYLNVMDAESVLDSVRRCWASLWSSHAIHYRQQKGFDHFNVLMAVVVQEMINSVSSGVMFTMNPVTGDHSEIMINSAWGLGEAVVSGLVTPDNILVAKETGVVKETFIAPQTIMIALQPGGGTSQEPVPANRVNACSLTELEIAELVKLGLTLEQHYGAPVDVEWCFTDGQVKLLQSRPITTL